ncbi:subunit theta of T-complex protein 1 [Chloropicon primus]|uniref:CCT-theta n=1 Tax=Chloropicon primus TaxID=1764295 RepID=A0A5B8MWC9_9CHLO|nr:subunit theta of T-complex protein 1 [Chloropicon primus]|eukprot:QDZ23945.1 subunit theta of T-complex protein 1 [Chloropicon primus]
MGSNTMGMPYGLQAMLKEGHKHFSGVEEAVMKSVEACKAISKCTRTSLGPTGLNKIIVNHLNKVYITSDAGTILTELEVQHPAAKLLVHAVKAQQQEVGDGANMVMSISGEMLSKAEALLRDGLHPTEVAEGYSKAAKKALELLKDLCIEDTKDLDFSDVGSVAERLKGALKSKQNGYEDYLAPLVAQACVDICPDNRQNFNVDNVRVSKLVGGFVDQSEIIQGIVVRRKCEGTVSCVENAPVAVFSQGVDTSSTETKGTVLIKSAQELKDYHKSEEKELEQIIKGIADLGTKVIISGQSIGEMAMHFIERYKMMAIKIPSKFELRRICRATGAQAIPKFIVPGKEQLGMAQKVEALEIGGNNVTVIKQDRRVGKVATIILRGATDHLMDDMERAIDDGVNTFKALCKDARILPGGGATEMALSKKLLEYGRKQTGLEQYAIQKFAEALEVIPLTLAENAGMNTTDTLAALRAQHAQGNGRMGVDSVASEITDLTKQSISDLFYTKYWAIKFAADAATTVLRVDQIIMAKQAGGPKRPQQGHWDDQ